MKQIDPDLLKNLIITVQITNIEILPVKKESSKIIRLTRLANVK